MQERKLAGKEQIKVMPAGLPFVAAGAVWFILALLLPVYKLSMTILITVIAVAFCVLLNLRRNKQLSLLPPAPTVKVRAQEMSKKLDIARISLLEKLPQIKNEALRASVSNITDSLEKIADNVEKDPNDRNKARKLANHYSVMLVELADKYIQLQSQAGAGDNIDSSMKKIEDGFAGADKAIIKLLDELFTDDAMEISADISVLDQLLKSEGSENKMDFSSLE